MEIIRLPFPVKKSRERSTGAEDGSSHNQERPAFQREWWQSLADQSREKDKDNRHDKSSWMKFRTRGRLREQTRDQTADDGPYNTQQCGFDKAHVCVHDGTCNEPFDKSHNNRPNNMQHYKV